MKLLVQLQSKSAGLQPLQFVLHVNDIPSFVRQYTADYVLVITSLPEDYSPVKS